MLNINLLGRILEAILRGRSVLHLGQILDLLQLLELLVVPNVGIVRRQTHQIVHQAEYDQQAADRGQDEHDFALFDAVLTEGLHLGLANVHVLLGDSGREHEVCKIEAQSNFVPFNKPFKILTKLRQIDAILVRLHVRVGAHVPEHGKDERYHRQEAQNQDPHNLQNVRDSHKHRARDATTNARSPRPVHLVAGRTGRQKSHKQDHQPERRHRSTDHHEDHLNGFNPTEQNKKSLKNRSNMYDKKHFKLTTSTAGGTPGPA